jgi:hypothetical protein
MIKILLMLSFFKDLFTKKDFFNRARAHAKLKIEKLYFEITYSQFIAGNWCRVIGLGAPDFRVPSSEFRGELRVEGRY